MEARSDYLYVVHQLEAPEYRPSIPLFKWNVHTLDADKMKSAYEEKASDLDPESFWGEREVQLRQ